MHHQHPSTFITEFTVRTCEDTSLNQNEDNFQPNPVQRPPTQNLYAPFETGDPVGLRRAVLPVFERDPDGRLTGLGTAFHVDGQGGLLTAEHVVDFMREGLKLSNDSPLEIDSKSNKNAVVMLGMGVCLGRVGVPQWAFPFVREVGVELLWPDDPMAEISGKPPRFNALDFARISVEIPRQAYDSDLVPKTLPVQCSGWMPKEGEYVLAFGYPQLKDSDEVPESMKNMLSNDGLHSAFGKISKVHPKGRDSMNPTPCFEVEAHWPGGMSGGPVVNESGNVIGIVSRSLLPDGELPGAGWATCLTLIPEIRE